VWGDRLTEVQRPGFYRLRCPSDGSNDMHMVYGHVIEAPGLKEYVLARHAALTNEDYAALEWAMWLLVSSVQMFPDLLQVETVDVDRWIENYAAKFEEHFRDR